MEAFSHRSRRVRDSVQILYKELKALRCKRQPGIVTEFVVELVDIDKKLGSFRGGNETAVVRLLEYIEEYIQHFHETVSKWKRSFDQDAHEDMIIMLSKIQLLNQYLTLAPEEPEDDLLLLPKSHPRRRALDAVMTVQRHPNPRALKDKFNDLLLTLATTEATVCQASKSKNWLGRKLTLGFSSVYYAFNKAAALKRALLFSAKPDKKAAFSLWRISDSWMVNNLLARVMDPITHNSLVYIPKIVDHIFGHRSHTNSKALLKELSNNSVQVRILHTRPVPLFEPRARSFIFHVHGGGFVSMSSASHQPYTRKWVNALDMPCLSIDYRLAPTHPFPAALEDLWQVYNWVLLHSEEVLGIEPGNIYLAGDSAGGNLVLALVYKLIESGLKLPKGVLAQYPALNLSKTQYSESMIFSLEDLVLPHGYFDLYLESYIQNPEIDPTTNYYVSPCQAPDHLLSQMPAVRLVVGDHDPFHDEVLKYTERLAMLGTDVKLRVYEGFMHGALNLCYAGGVEESLQMVDQVASWIAELENSS